MALIVSESVIVPFHRNLAQLSECLQAIRRAAPAVELIVAADGATEDCRPLAERHRASVVVVPGPRGPAVARNRAADVAAGDILVFVDTDVTVAPDALARIRRVLDHESEVAAVFGAYDRSPADPGFISQFKNLSHTYYHEVGREDAATFWAGLGAVRAGVFRAVGGFDERFSRPSVEDIELGYRIRGAGHRIRLDPSVRGKHLKRWTLWGCVVTDVRARGVPWTQLIYRYDALANDLNTSHALRASVVVAYLTVGTAVMAAWSPWWLVAAPAWLGTLVVLNAGYYRWMAERRGIGFALRVVPVHLLHHLCNGVSFAAGTVLRLASRLGLHMPGALPADVWANRGTPSTASRP